MTILEKTFLSAGISLAPHQGKRFETLLVSFLAKNAQVNLSAIRDERGVVEKHFIDSLAIRNVPEFLRAERVLDVGTGGGFPGLPLSIMFPNKYFVLMDATRKKVDAVAGFAMALGLENVRTVWGRAESVDVLRSLPGKFDCVVARAVTYLPDLLALVAPYLAPGGTFIAYKQPSAEELEEGKKACAKIGLRFLRTEGYVLPSDATPRALLLFSKA